MAEIPNTYIVKKSQVDDIPTKEGTIYTSDTNELYVTTKDGTRSKISSVIIADSGVTVSDILAPISGKIYIFSDGSCYLYSSKWIRLDASNTDDFYSKTPIRISTTTNPTTLDSGIYSVEGELSTDNGYPLNAEWLHATIYVYGGKASDYGYRVIRYESIYNDRYIKFQQWSSWSDWISLRDAATLGGHSANYFQPAMFQGIDDLLNVSSNTIYYCNHAKNSPYANGLIDASVGICISSYLSDSNNKYITLIYIPTGNSTIFVANISASSTSINWRKINDGGNADTISGKGISDLFIKTSQYIRIEETDFNTITTMGAYTIGTENNSLMTESRNQPVGAYQWGTMVVFVSGGYGLTQVYYTHTGDTYVRGLYGGNNWNSWKKCGENADTLDGKHATDFYPQGSAYGSSDFTISSGYNKIIAGNISGVDWGMNICKESDEDGIAPSLFVSESGRNVCSYRMGDNGTSNTYSTSRRTLSVGACATIVVAASDTYPESAKFSADYICNGTNDQNTINAAINTLSSSQGGKVILLNGTYNLSGMIKIDRSNVTIEGMGDSTYLKNSATDIFQMNASSLSNISIKNLRVCPDYSNLLYFGYGSVDCKVTNLNLENINNYENDNPMYFIDSNALTTTLVSYLTINNCKFLNCVGIAIERCSNVIFNNNTINGSDRFNFIKCTFTKITNNTFSNDGGLVYYDCGYITILNNFSPSIGALGTNTNTIVDNNLII